MIEAGIVTFNPDIDKLDANIRAILPQVEKLVIVDNNSNNITRIEELIKCNPKIHIIKNSENYGIAKALNQILRDANSNGAEWVLTLDQDSVCYEDIISTLYPLTNKNKVGMISPLIDDKNVGKIRVNKIKANEIESCITSGCLTNVTVCLAMGGFDETMFIDLVDTEMCYRLRRNGYSILQANKVCMKHEIGTDSKTINIFGKKIYLFNHSPFREYYCARNTIYLARKYKDDRKKMVRSFLTVINRTFIVFLFEDNRIKKLLKRIEGIRDGLIMNITNGDIN